ncbi:HAMP domain-containing histidine kinase [Nordella sp. HKS 07]|uniref:sensor histidine kinase n=1 Tax=Nordella sp. HKS 07 TaxID=2712222 RepID=UPI0013E1952A|nr:HAMP domain-containing sensor histidine kinase [Nordella sp. HKS 07]QIG46654.1 HAMP domain-containing histidine kinase [Nordella sp. HKS 07]
MKFSASSIARNPISWPITVKVPMLVVLLMVIISAVITNRVLARLADTQERHLEQLGAAYLDGLSASLILSVVREDIWEVFDALDRSRERYRGLNVEWAVVTNGSNNVLAATDPTRFPSDRPLAPEILSQFSDAGVELGEQLTTAHLARPLIYQSREIGHIYALADIRLLLQERADVFATLVLTNIILTSVLAAIGYFAVRRMVQPIRILSVYLDRSTQGPLEPIPPNVLGLHGGEFRRLFTRYNALARAVNERQELAAKLAEEEKLASLGRLASGLAHEINNPLGGMFNALDSLRRHGNREGVRATSVRLLEQGLAGIRDLVRSTLAVYRDGGDSRSLMPGDIDDLKLLIEPEIKRKHLNVRWTNDISTSTPLPAAPVRDAILNILLNACEACGEGGAISLTARTDGNSAIFEVADNGPGLPSHLKDYLEHPDAGSAPIGRRSGLGLWMVKRLCQELGGRIYPLDNEHGGALIRLVMPFMGEELSHVA